MTDREWLDQKAKEWATSMSSSDPKCWPMESWFRGALADGMHRGRSERYDPVEEPERYRTMMESHGWGMPPADAPAVSHIMGNYGPAEPADLPTFAVPELPPPHPVDADAIKGAFGHAIQEIAKRSCATHVVDDIWCCTGCTFCGSQAAVREHRCEDWPAPPIPKQAEDSGLSDILANPIHESAGFVVGQKVWIDVDEDGLQEGTIVKAGHEVCKVRTQKENGWVYLVSNEKIRTTPPEPTHGPTQSPAYEQIRKSISEARHELQKQSCNALKADCVILAKEEFDTIKEYFVQCDPLGMAKVPDKDSTFMGLPIHVVPTKKDIPYKRLELIAKGKRPVSTQDTVGPKVAEKHWSYYGHKPEQKTEPAPGNWAHKDFVPNPSWGTPPPPVSYVELFTVAKNKEFELKLPAPLPLPAPEQKDYLFEPGTEPESYKKYVADIMAGNIMAGLNNNPPESDCDTPITVETDKPASN